MERELFLTMTLAQPVPAKSQCIPHAASRGELTVPAWASRLVAGGVNREVHVSGIAEFRTSDAGEAALVTARVPDALSLDAERLTGAARQVYATIMSTLRTLRAGYAARFWNFVPRVCEPMAHGMDRYTVFNAGRFAVLRGPSGLTSLSDFPCTITWSVPTATAVGHAGTDLFVHCLSLAAPGRAIENPRQIPAYRYSRRFGPLPPCFSRATAVVLPDGGRDTLLVGGTASVVGEDSRHRDDVALQFEETCLNLRSLLAAWEPPAGPNWAERFREVRCYAPAFPSALVDLIRRTFGNAPRVECVEADLCRRELAIEIEGVVEGAGYLGSGAGSVSMRGSDQSVRLLDRLVRHARSRPDAEAFRECGRDGTGRCMSYRKLAERVPAVATAIASSASGAVVLLSCPNRVEFPVGYLAVLAAGGVVMPVHAHIPPSQLLALAHQVSAGLVIGGEEAVSAARSEGFRTMRCEDLMGPDPVSITGADKPLPLSPLPGPALLLQSSGTTGSPHVAIRSAGSLDTIADAGAQALRLTPDDRVLVGIPLCHSYGMEAGLLVPVFAGCSVRLMDGFDATVAIEEFRDGATVFPGVPFMFEALTLLVPADGLGRSLRTAFSAGGPMPQSLAARFREVTGLGLGQLYGATELGWVTFDDGHGQDHYAATVGFPMAGVSLRILDPNEPDLRSTLPPNVEGQIAVATPSMLSGYLHAQAPMIDGHFLTGDLGRMDGHGRLTLTGRLKLLIDVGGLKVNPIEVEQVLLQHPGVGECVVVPIRMSETAERLRAVVTPVRGLPTGSLSTDALRRFAGARLAPHKVPRVFDIRDSIPRSPAGKVLRGALEGA